MKTALNLTFLLRIVLMNGELHDFKVVQLGLLLRIADLDVHALLWERREKLLRQLIDTFFDAHHAYLVLFLLPLCLLLQLGLRHDSIVRPQYLSILVDDWHPILEQLERVLLLIVLIRGVCDIVIRRAIHIVPLHLL